MIRKFFKDSAIYGGSHLLTGGISLILLPFLSRAISPADFGIIDILAIFAFLINAALPLEVAHALMRFLPESKSQEEKTLLSSTAFWFAVAAYTLFTILVLFFAESFAGWLLDSAAKKGVFRAAMLSLWANGLFVITQSQLRAQLKSVEHSIGSILFAVVSMIVTLFLVIHLRWGVIGYFYGTLTGSLLGLALMLFYGRDCYRFSFDLTKLKGMLNFSIPLVPAGIAIFVSTYVDRIAIKSLMTLSDLGIYGVAWRIALIVGLILIGFQGALTPLVFAHHEDRETPFQLERIFRYFLYLAMLLFAVLTLFAKEILFVVAPSEYAAAYAIIPLLSLAHLFAGMAVFAPGLAIVKKTKIIAAINIASAGLNAILNWLLIPSMGIAGAALATLISAVCAFITFMILSQKNYPVPHQWLRVVPGLLVVIGLCLWGGKWGGGIALSSIKLLCLVGGGLLFLIYLFGIQESKDLLIKLKEKSFFNNSKYLE